MQLKKLVLPEPERPMIPHFKGMFWNFQQKYMIYWSIQRFLLHLHPILTRVKWQNVLYDKSPENQYYVKPGRRSPAST